MPGNDDGRGVATSRAASGKIARKLYPLIGRTYSLSEQGAREIEAILNEMGEDRVRAIHAWCTLATLPLLFVLAFGLAVPLLFAEVLLFGRENGLVVSAFHWSWVLAFPPIFMAAAIVSSSIALGIGHAIHRLRWPGQSSTYLRYLGESASYGSSGFKIEFDQVSFSRVLLLISLAVYALAVGICLFCNYVMAYAT